MEEDLFIPAEDLATTGSMPAADYSPELSALISAGSVPDIESLPVTDDMTTMLLLGLGLLAVAVVVFD